ncbi:MAG TPA: methionyl-tRNA formyltransferase, partial [Pyrinomonadaceae bacterium]|nr:methionyl-tRNA formyltransferase [Pyrinomonadaceae bacterium]
IVFMGTPEAAVPVLRRLLEDRHEIVAVWTQPDRPAGRGNKLSAPPVKVLAQLFGLKIYQPEKIRTEEAKSLFASHNADLAVVVAYGRILPAEFLSAPKRGCINVHFSLLPLYRGAAPVNWAIINGEEKTGVTTMFIEEELDSGPILLQQETQIGEMETAPELMGRLAETGAELLGETMAQLDEITPRPQHDRDATFAPMLRKENGLIDWSKNAFAVERIIRGLQPWPNAYTNHQTHRLIVWRAKAARAELANAVPGEVVASQGDDLIVKCGGETTLRLIEVQPEAKRRMSARDFMNGTHLKVGDTLA